MAKKIIDIIEVDDLDEKETFFKQEAPQKVKKPASKIRRAVLLIVIILCLAGGVLFWLSLRATLKIDLTLNQETLEFEQLVNVVLSAENVDIESNLLPGKLFEKDTARTESFAVQGRETVGEKARGVIRVYNDYKPVRSITLIPQTRFLSQNSKLFRAPESIYLPPAKVNGGKITPGFKDVEVLAVEPGEDYNIGPSKFSLPGLLGGQFYYNVWGESSEPMAGGYKKEAPQVSDSDLKNGQDSLRQTLEASVISELKKSIPSDYVLVEKMVPDNLTEINCLAKTGDKVESFRCEGSNKFKGLGFKADDLQKIIDNVLTKKTLPAKTFRLETLTIEAVPVEFSLKEGRAVLNIKVKVNIFEPVDKNKLAKTAAGEKVMELKKIILDKYPQISDVEVKVFPFWLWRVPDNLGKITVNYSFKQ